MKNVLILGMGHLSNGEITIAVETLRTCPDNGYNLLAISHEKGCKYIRSLGIDAQSLDFPDPKRNAGEFLAIIKSFKPDCIICADVYTMDYASTWSGFDFEFLKTLGIPIGSFDQYEWESTDFTWDFMGVVPINIKKELITDCDFLIRPCPLNKTSKNTNRIITCRLFGEEPKKPSMTRKAWCDELGIDEDRKIIFTVNSGWEYIDITRSFELGRLMDWMPKIIYNLLKDLDEPVTVVHVGPQAWSSEPDRKVTYKHFANLPARLYQETEKHTDLFCGTNAISITMSKVIHAQKPCILFQNLKTIDFNGLKTIMPKMPAWYRDMASHVKKAGTFRIFPWGWANFLKPVLSDNSYNDTFAVAPVFVPKESKQVLNKHLFDAIAIENLRNRQGEYFFGLQALPPVDESLAKVI
jgi:hypothetical protein